MNIDTLIAGRNNQLYNKLAQEYQISIIADAEGESWGSEAKNGVATIFWSPTNHPDESFAHELLHLQVQSNGYKPLRLALTDACYLKNHLKSLLEEIDNEFQHYRMYDEFIKLGYKAELFYHDTDVAIVIKHLTAVLAMQGLGIFGLGLQYLTILAPGGTLTDAHRSALKLSFRQYNNGYFANKFDEIDVIMDDWANKLIFDAKPFIERYVKVILTESVWFGYSGRFPQDGYFINGTFEPSQVC